jgi:hypothetical protein
MLPLAPVWLRVTVDEFLRGLDVFAAVTEAAA